MVVLMMALVWTPSREAGMTRKYSVKNMFCFNIIMFCVRIPSTSNFTFFNSGLLVGVKDALVCRGRRGSFLRARDGVATGPQVEQLEVSYDKYVLQPEKSVCNLIHTMWGKIKQKIVCQKKNSLA